MARNRKPKLILRTFVDPQTFFPVENSFSIRHCKILLFTAKWETIKANQLQVSRARSLFTDLLETSIFKLPTSCAPPPLKL